MTKSLETRISNLEKRASERGEMVYITPDKSIAVARYSSAEERQRLDEESRKNGAPMSREEWVRTYCDPEGEFQRELRNQTYVDLGNTPPGRPNGASGRLEASE